MSERPRASHWQKAIVIASVVAILAMGFAYVTQGLTRWQAYDDEGGYLYAAWRISLGEVPYRDFLTPQLPVFLYPGAALMMATAYSVVAARLAMACLTLAAALCTFASVRRLWGVAAALAMLPLLLVQQEFFWASRFFRPEAPMLFWGMLGLWLFMTGYPARRKGLLCLAGAALALSTMAKLFGALIVGGIGLYVLVEGLCTRNWRDMWKVGLWIAAPYGAIVLGLTLIFSSLAPGFLAAVLGHHLRQGSGAPFGEVVRKGLGLYRDAIQAQPVFMALAGVGAVCAWRQRGLGRALVWQIPTALAFMGMTRDLQIRHLTYLAPSLASLAAFGLVRIWVWIARESGLLARRVLTRRALASVLLLAGIVAALWPQWRFNAWVASWEEHDTAVWADLLQRYTAPDDYIMADYPGLNFAAKRPTTPTAAGISRGAAQSGQITGAQLIQEIEDYDVQMVLLNVAQGAHQFAFLRDYETFKHYVQTHFHLIERRVYDYRLIEVYHRNDLWAGERRADDFGRLFSLTGSRWEHSAAEPGQDLHIYLRWQKTELGPAPADYAVGLRLLDTEGHVRGLGSKTLVDVDRETYWDEAGLEQAVLIPTRHWPAAETTIDLYQLPIDPGTPPGVYRVTLRLHPVGAWAGLMTFDASGAPRGYDLDLGTAVVLPASQAPHASDLPMQTHIDLDMTPDVRMEGYTLPEGALLPGDRFTASIFWSALSVPATDYRLRLSLEAQGRSWAETVTDLAGPQHPTTRWRSGEVLLGMHDLAIDATTPAGDYTLLAELLDRGRPVARHEIGQIHVLVRARIFEAPHFGHADGAHWGDAITLLGHDLSPLQAQPSVPLSLTLYWRADRQINASYTAFVHLVDGAERIWGQADRIPADGYRTTAWWPEEVVADAYTLTWADGAVAGEYRLAIGLYDAETGIRLPAYDAKGQRLADDRYVVGAVTLP